MEYIKVSQAAEKWGISPRRVRLLCSENRIDGAIRRGNLYMIPASTPKPIDGRSLKGKEFSSEFLALFLKIQSRKEEIDRNRNLTKGEVERLHEEFLVNFTYNSNAIEGNTLTLKETAMVLEGITIDQKPLKDHLEAVGHRDAFLYIQDIVGKQENLSEYVIKSIHSLVLIDRPEDKGIFRRIPVTIMGAFKKPPQPYMVEPLITELLQNNEQQKKTMHPIERIARFHLEFEGIHPFIDGNGRTGRLLINLDLMQNGYLPINVKFTDRKKYYDAFDAYYRDDNAGTMIELIARYVDERLDQYLDIINFAR